ncbi:HET-domain-containing protein, partial [Hyaloscypha variabilis F]
MLSERCAELDVYTNADSPLPPGNFARRLPESPEDSRIVHEWLVECMENHEKCKKAPISNSQRVLPSRLINVGPSDGSQDPRLEEGQNWQGKYLTLSHRWGDPSTITQTVKETLLRFKEQIPFKSLTRVFQDAIKITRLLHIKYIWVDSLCIVQDSPADKEAEISRMAEIYENALLNLSASIATSSASALFTSRKMKNLVKIPKNTPSESDIASPASFLTNHTLASFSDDVPNGTLGSRGWCFQERLLSFRILHFGRDQLHWECHEGIWSESSTKRHKRQKSGIRWLHLLPRNILLHYRQMYDEWYKAVSAYTNRELTDPIDKLPALAGASSRFNVFLNDAYAAGIWGGDLPQGLLWSR